MTIYTHLESPLGELLLTSREGALTGLYFADQLHAPRVGHDWVGEDEAEIFVQTGQELAEYVSGERTRFDLSLGLAGTAFQVLVWNAIAAIPFGSTLTYSELAQRIGMPKKARAVGMAAGRNPVCWIVPCHRVVGKNGALTGYAGGVSRKSALLDFEAARSAHRDAVLSLGERPRVLELA